MKVQIVSVVLLTVFSTAFCASFFSEKENAKNAVNDKFKEVNDLIHKIEADLTAEEQNKEEKNKELVNTMLQKKSKESEEQLAKISRETTKQAIAKGKPISSIECIANIFINGQKLISDNKEADSKKINDVLEEKKKKLVLLKVEINLVKDASGDVKNEILKKIENALGGFEALKNDAFKKADTMLKQLHEIETRVDKPKLSELYIALRKQIEKNYKDIVESLSKQLQKCIA